MLLSLLNRAYHYAHVAKPSSEFMLSGNFSSHSSMNQVVATKFCSCHDSYAVGACAKICCDSMTRNWITVKRYFHHHGIILWKNASEMDQCSEFIQAITEPFQLILLQYKQKYFCQPWPESLGHIDMSCMFRSEKCVTGGQINPIIPAGYIASNYHQLPIVLTILPIKAIKYIMIDISIFI